MSALLLFSSSPLRVPSSSLSTFARRGLQLAENLPASLNTTYTIDSLNSLIRNGLGCDHVLCGGHWRVFDDMHSVWIRSVEEGDIMMSNGQLNGNWGVSHAQRIASLLIVWSK